jgi:hypothetical protein
MCTSLTAVVYEGGGDGTGNPGPSIEPFVPEVEEETPPDDDDEVPRLTFGVQPLFPGPTLPLLLKMLFSTVRRI